MDGDTEGTSGLSKKSDSPQTHHYLLDSYVHSVDSAAVEQHSPSDSTNDHSVNDSSVVHTNSTDNPSVQPQKHSSER